MPDQTAFKTHELLTLFDQHVRGGTEDARVFCVIGREFHALGKSQETKRCYKRAVQLLLAAIRRGDPAMALSIEWDVYEYFVKLVETEEHHYRCFADWREDMARLGRRFRDSQSGSGADPRRIAFVIGAGRMLGHTEVLLRYLTAYSRAGNGRADPAVYAIDGCNSEFRARFTAAGVKVISPKGDDPSLNDAGLDRKILALRERLRADKIGCAVWVSQPNSALFALSCTLAPVQIFWALKFHPIAGNFIDGYLTYGAPGTTEKYFGKQAWRVVRTPLAIESPEIDPAMRARIRAKYPEPFLFGTVAREDKIRSPEFLKAVAAILKNCPDAGYVWTGMQRDKEIDDFFTAQGVGERCHYAGWVDAPLYGSAFDAFLETFPLGCGVTGYQALGAGTPLLSYMAENTVFGMQYWNETMAGAAPNLSTYPVLCARSPQEYVQLAAKLVADADFRSATGQQGQTFFEQEIALGVSYANEFFGAIEDVVAAKLVPAGGGRAACQSHPA